MKRFLAAVLCILMLIVSVPTQVYAESIPKYEYHHPRQDGYFEPGDILRVSWGTSDHYPFNMPYAEGYLEFRIQMGYLLNFDDGAYTPKQGKYSITICKYTGEPKTDPSNYYKYYDINDNVFRSGFVTLYSSSPENLKIKLPRGNYLFIVSVADNTPMDIFVTDFRCLHKNSTSSTIKSPTCNEEGIEEIVCKDCGETVREDIDKLDHEPADDWTVIDEVSCLQDGKKVKYCTACNEVVDEKTTNKLSHKFSKWEQVKKATCSEEGQEKRICSACNTEETRKIEKLSHKYSRWEETKAPTCSQAGEKKRICSVCSDVDIDSVEPIAHKYSKWEETREATCSNAGEEKRSCSVCGFVDTRETDTKKHTYGSWTTTRSATCDNEGQRERVCKVCSYKELDEIEKTRHDYTAWNVTKKATESSSGSRTRTCNECGYKDTETLSRLEHGEETYTEETKAATCTEEGKEDVFCEYCNQKIKSRSTEPLGHRVTGWSVTRQATPYSNGTKQGTCTRCKETISESIQFEGPGKDGFKQKRSYDSRFGDIKQADWHYKYVTKAYEYELANGMSEDVFSPDSTFTVAQALTVACNIHSAYYGKKIDAAKSNEAWYTPYVNYCIQNNIITKNQFSDYNKNITRGEMAIVFTAILPEVEYTAVRSGALGDVSSSMACYEAVARLYRAGIINGDKETGNFRPNDQIKRSEACVIFTAIVVSDYRSK